MTTYGPANIDPAQWRPIASFYRGSNNEIAREYADHWNTLIDALTTITGHNWETGEHTKTALAQYGVDYHENGGCASCGAWFDHGAVFQFIDPDADPDTLPLVPVLIAVGQICAWNLFGLSSIKEKLVRKAAKRAVRNEFEQLARDTIAADRELAAAYEWSQETDGYTSGLALVQDIFSKMVRYGSISEAQRQLIVKVHAQEIVWAAQRATREEAIASGAIAKVPITDERIQFTGQIVSVKWYDSDMAYNAGAWKMVFEDDRGFRLFGSLPAAVRRSTDTTLWATVRCTFWATVKPSPQDPVFGYFKRPTKVEVLEAEQLGLALNA